MQIEGDSYEGIEVPLDLGNIPESTRQAVIASFKLAIAYCNGNKIDQKRSMPLPKEEGTEKSDMVELPSLSEKFIMLLNELYPTPNVHSTQTEEAAKADVT